MDADLRSLAWKSVERVLADLHISVGASFPVAVMVKVRTEGAVADVRTELGRAGLEVAGAERAWWPFGRRWSIAAKSKPVPIDRAEMDRWLDALESSLARHDAVVAGWVPLLPGA
jgi:hypothetical protein